MHAGKLRTCVTVFGLFLIFLFIPVHKANATHAVGIDLTYECLGGGQYRFNLNFYRDCAGVNAPGSAVIRISSASCGVTSTVSLSKSSVTEVSAICPSANSTCSGGSFPGIEQHTYTGTFNLPPGCGNDWVISYSTCCRNYAITNLSSPGSQNLYVEATLDNTTPTCQSSAIFTALPVPYLCAGQDFFYNHGAVDIDGDVLEYELVNPLNGANQPIGYQGGFNPTNPMNTNGGFGFDQNTGQMSFNPSGTQQAVVSVIVREYRNGVLIGTVTRDLQLVVINCNNVVPSMTGIDGGNNFTIDICAGFPLCFDVFSNDPDAGQSTTITYNNGIPGGSFTTSGSPLQNGTFCWTPSPADAGLNNFTIEVTDDACPIPGLGIYNYTINVIPNPNPPADAGPDQNICQGESVQLNATTPIGGVTYVWSPAAGLSCTACPNPVATPAVTTVYTIEALYPDQCVSTDQVTVTVQPTPLVSVFPAQATICTGTSVTLTATGSSTVTSYRWSPGGQTGSSITVSPTAPTTYTVVGIDAFGCESEPDTAVIDLSPPPPGAVCNNIYVTPTGAGGGLSPLDPTSLSNALTIGACNSVTIKMAIGTYTVDAGITGVTSFMTLEGGFDPGNNWVKTSQPGATTIYRSALNPEGPANAPRLVAIYLNSVQYTRFQDITIQTADAVDPGVSNYGVHMVACSEYDFVRTRIILGAPGDGGNGATGANGSPGGNGVNGLTGAANTQGNPGHGGNGGSGGGGTGGTLGAGGFDANGAGCCAIGPVGVDGSSSTSVRGGGAGGGGGCGGEGAFAGGAGGDGGGINAGIGPVGGPGGAAGAPGAAGTVGATGANGGNGATGANGVAGTHGAFYVNSMGADGGDGEGGRGGSGGGGGGGESGGVGANGAGNGGGGGGGGGEGGQGGRGALGGGAAYAAYLFSNGANGNFIDCEFTMASMVSTGATGGTGGTGAGGGSGGTGASTSTTEIGRGGNGGPGGRGGNGAPGGDALGFTGFLTVYQDGTVPVVAQWFTNLGAMPVIMADNISCTDNPMDFTSTLVRTWSFGAGATPTGGTGTLVNTQYSTTGRKDITFGSDIFRGFVNVAINGATFTPDITSSATQIGPTTYQVCQGDQADFFTSTLGTAYDWDFGGAVTPNTYTTQNVLGPTFNTLGSFTITLRVNTDCCGWSQPGTITVVVEERPALVIAGNLSMCEGETTTLTASGGVTYTWTPNLFLNTDTGPTVVSNPPATQTYVVTAYNAAGTCFDQQNVTVTINPPPTLTPSTVSATCGANGSATVTPSAGSGTYTYQWDAAAGGVTTQTASNLLSGTYGVVVTDAVTGCQDSIFINVPPTSTPVAFTSGFSNVSCYGGNNGTATAIAFSGTPPYSYVWSNGDVTDLATNLSATTYFVTVTDAGGCTSMTSITLTQPDSLYVNITLEDSVSCNGGSDGRIGALGDGGVGGFTYIWSDGQTTDTAINLTAGTYSVTVTDDSSCTASTSATIFEPSPLLLTLNGTTDVGCNGASNGGLDVSASGGVPGYEYSINGTNFFPTGVFTGLAAGTYTVTARDANSCDTTLMVDVLEPVALAINLFADSASCSGINNARIDVAVTGGARPYQYQMNSGGFQTDSFYINLAPGTYSFDVMDANGCTNSASITVGQPAALVLTLTQISVTCNGGSDGQIVPTTTGGTLPYRYRVGAGPLLAVDTITGLGPGNYFITVQDAAGCTNAGPVTVLEPPVLNINVATTDASCGGYTDGSIVVTASGGVPGYEYSLDAGPYQASPTFNGIGAALYTVNVRDAGGCVQSTAAFINQPTPVTTTPVITDVTCNGDGNGAFNLNPVGGAPPLQFSLNGGAFGATFSWSGLSGGTYIIDIRDNNGCLSDDTIIVIEPGPIAVAATQDSVSCPFLSDGRIDIGLTGGTAPFQYGINGGTLQVDSFFTGLSAGNYTIQIQDANGCVGAGSIAVLQPAPMRVTIVVDSVSCFGLSDGVLTASGVGGTTPYEFSLDGSTFQSSNIFNGLGIGTYTVTMRDAAGCTVTGPARIFQPASMTLALVQDSATCGSTATGSITATVGGGQPVYQYRANGGAFQTSNIFTGLAAGMYIIEVQDGQGCSIIDSIAVLEPAPIAVSTVQDSVSCNGLSDGVITVTASSGSPGYQYSLNGAAFQASNVFNGLSIGNYIISVQDSRGCVINDTIDVLEPPALTLALVQDSVDCNGFASGTITATGAGGSPGYQYNLNAGPYQASGIFSGLNAGSYSVNVRDAGGCITNSTIDILEPTLLTITLTQDSVSCNTGSDGSITATGAGGIPPYEFRLNVGVYQSGNVFTGLSAGTNTVFIRDANNCTQVANIDVLEPPAIGLSLVQDSVTCTGGSDGSITATGSGGTTPYQYSLDGGTFQNNNFFSGLSDGTYTITIRDAEGCTTSSNVDVLGPPVLTIGLVQTPVSCFGFADGVITATGGGGTPNYQFNIDGGPYQVSGTFNGQLAGLHTIGVQDAVGCITTDTITITQPVALTITLAGDSVSCNGLSDGAITVTVTGGTPAFQYSLDGAPFQAGNSFTGLAAANYSVDVRDANGCTFNNTITIGQPAAIALTLTQDSISCNAGADGSITATGSGGIAPLEYSINGGTFQPGNVFTGLTAANYSVDVRDANGCTTNATIDVLEPAAIGISLVQDSVTCSGGADGSITVTGSGGTTPYEYSLDGTIFQSSNVFTGLSDGTFTVTLRDDEGCTVSANIDVLGPPLLTIGLVHTPVSCFGFADGVVTATGGGGTPNYEFNIDGGPYQVSGVFNGLLAGLHTVGVRDAVGCITTDTITVTQPIALTITLAPDSVTCNGLTDGAITITVTGGTPAFQYSLDGAPFQAGNSYTGLGAANYSVDVRDANGCTFNNTTTIGEPAALTISLAQDSVVCGGQSDGQITVTVTGGSGPYEYSLNSGAYQASNVFTGLAAANYTVDVRDAKLCTISDNITVLEPDPVTIALVQDSASCFAATDGVITVTAGGGTAPYQYSVNGGALQASNIFTGLAAGNYTVSVQDVKNCGLTDIIAVLEPGVVTSSTTVTDITCNGGSDGTATITVTGGSLPYTYNWSSTATTQTATGLSVGSYTVVATDARGCTIGDGATIAEPTAIVITETLTDPSCTGDSDGSITLSVTGGTPNPGYTYSWSTGGNGSGVNGLSSGPYSVTVTDGNGCTATESYTLTDPVSVAVVPTDGQVSCAGDVDGQVSVTASGGTPGYTYSWNTTPVQFGATATGLSPGTYDVVITDARGCTISSTAEVTSPTAVTLALSPINPTCFGLENGAVTASAGGGVGGYTFEWSHDSGLTTNLALGVPANGYSVTVFDGNGCSITESVTLTEPAPIGVSLAAEDSTLGFGQEVQLFASPSTNAVRPYIYTWNPNDRLDCVDCDDPIASDMIESTTFVVTLTDGNQCEAQAELVIEVDVFDKILVAPNAFSPNGDGVNDFFNVYGLGVEALEFQVFNRWGEKVFESNDIDTGWDGFFKSELQLPGAYVFKARATYIDGATKLIKGSVTLIR